LAGPVQQLQNALSFNYYANTEMYDERAVATEDTTAIDTALLNSIRNNEPLGPINSSEDVANDLGETIGELISSTPFSGGVQTGVLQYKKIFNEFIDNTRNYFQESLNVYDTVLNQFNKGIWSQFVNQRNFYNGSFQNLQTPISATLIGKPVYYQNVINSLAEDYANKFETQDTLAIGLNNLFTGGTFSELTYNKIINNYSNLITSTAESNFSSLATIAQDISDVQSKLTIMIEKLDFISFSGDAKVLKDNSAKFYFLTGQTNSLTKFKEDYSIVVNSITAFTNAISGTLIIPSNLVSGTFTNFIPINNTQFQNLDSYAFTLFSDKILDETKLQDFLTSLTNGLDETEVSVAKDSIKNIIDNKWKTLFSDEKNAEKTEFENLKNTTVIKDCVNFNPTSNGVSLSTDERKMDFSTSGNDSAYTTPFDNIRSTQNTNNDPISYNGKKQYNG